MTNGGPLPNHDVPEAEPAGFHRPIGDFTKTQLRMTPPSGGARDSLRKLLPL
jgi:hypothetical protein